MARYIGIMSLYSHGNLNIFIQTAKVKLILLDPTTRFEVCRNELFEIDRVDGTPHPYALSPSHKRSELAFKVQMLRC